MDIILKTYYIIPYIILFVLLVVYGLLKSTICNLFAMCCNKKMNLTSKYKENVSQDFFKSLSEYQLNRLKLMTEKELTRVMNQRNRRNSMQQRLRTD
jgi:predicted Holliday junction resolvase-like endonuclease